MTTTSTATHTDTAVSPERLRELLNPTSVVIVGANSGSMWSHYSFTNLRDGGFKGDIHLVNRRGEPTHGEQTYSSIAEVPGSPDLAIVLTGPNSLEAVLEDCRAKGIRNLVTLASGLSEAGAEGAALEAQIVAQARANDQLILGPNNLGFVNAQAGIAAFTHMNQVPLTAGGVGVASQSGALCIYLTPHMASRGIGTSYIVTVGNEAMVSVTDVMAMLVEDPGTKVITAYMEQIEDPERFLDVAARARQAGKPMVIFKAGRGEVAARVASAHTGSLVGDDKVVEAACRQHGVIRVDSIEDLVATAGILEEHGRLPASGRVGVVTASGAMCALIAERAETTDLELPIPSPDTVAALHGDGLPDFATVNNPLDVTGYVTIDPSIMLKGYKRFAEDPAFDILVINGNLPQDEAAATMMSSMMAGTLDVLKSTDKPIVPMSFLPTVTTPFAREWARREGHPHVSDSFDRGIPALDRAVWWSRRLSELEIDDAVPEPAPVPRPDSEGWTEVETAAFLREHGVPVVPSVLATSADEAAAAAAEVGYPVVLKVASKDIAHKTDVGGVRLNLRDEAGVREAFDGILAAVREAAPEADVAGVSVSPMRTGGQELLVGIVRDPHWGLVLAVGFGGVLVEVLKDSALRLLPVGPQEIRRMLDSLQGIELLRGFRGEAAVDLDTVAQAIFAVAQLARSLGDDLLELEINPLRVSSDRVEALDALMVWKDAR